VLSPSIHKFGNEFIPSGLSAALGHELEAEWLGPNGVSIVLMEDLRIYVTVIANRSTKYVRDKEEKRA
jgi:hypothetical protein